MAIIRVFWRVVDVTPETNINDLTARDVQLMAGLDYVVPNQENLILSLHKEKELTI